jgi:hypothetical protein
MSFRSVGFLFVLAIALSGQISTSSRSSLHAQEGGGEGDPTLRDCNGNSLDDALDIERGNARDINDNGVPDSCEGGKQTPGDLNQDGIFDAADPRLLLTLFFLGPPDFPCGDGRIDNPANVALLDANNDVVVDPSDAVFLFRNLFLDGPPHILGFDCIPLPECSDVCDGPPVLFRRGDVNGSGRVNLVDPIDLLIFMFRGDPVVVCEKAADANDDNRLDTTDAFVILEFLFLLGPKPAAPFVQCGVDPTEDLLTCRGFLTCNPDE